MKRFLSSKIKKLRKIKEHWILVHKPYGKKAYFVDLPDYENLGDSAIALSQIKFLEKCGFSSDRIKTFTYNEFSENVDYLKKHISKKHLICGIGGGNMGNQWYPLELVRYQFIDTFPKNPIVIFPQTLHFTNDENGKQAIKESFKHYDNHSKLTIVAREQATNVKMNELYKNPEIILTPDIVLSSVMSDYNVKIRKRSGALVVFRNDAEKSMNENDRDKIISFIEQFGVNVKMTEMNSECAVTQNNRFELVKSKMQEFADAEFVITDRLHGMVFAAITGTPCIVFSNYNHKVKGTYDWIKYLNYIKYVENVEGAQKYIPELLKMKDCKFDNTPLIKEFDKLKEVIKRYVN